MKTVQASVEAAAPAEVCYEVLVDFERYPEFLPDHKVAEVLERTGKSVLVRWEVEIVKRLEYVCRQHLDPPRGLHWEFVRGSLRDTVGGWKLDPLGPERTLVHYEIGVDVGRFIPSFVQAGLLKTTLPLTLDRFRRRFEEVWARKRLANPPRPPSASPAGEPASPPPPPPAGEGGAGDAATPGK